MAGRWRCAALHGVELCPLLSRGGLGWGMRPSKRPWPRSRVTRALRPSHRLCRCPYHHRQPSKPGPRPGAPRPGPALGECRCRLSWPANTVAATAGSRRIVWWARPPYGSGSASTTSAGSVSRPAVRRRVHEKNQPGVPAPGPVRGVVGRVLRAAHCRRGPARGKSRPRLVTTREGQGEDSWRRSRFSPGIGRHASVCVCPCDARTLGKTS